MDVQEVKGILEFDHTDHDNYIKTMLPLAEDFAKNYCGIEYVTNPNYDPYKPISSTNPRKIEGTIEGGMKIAVAKLLEFNLLQAGINSEGVASVSQSFSTELPNSIKDMLKPYKKAKFY
jgi:hypothetical protein